MHFPDREDANIKEARRTVWEALGLISVLASTALPLLLCSMTFSRKASGNDFGSRGMALVFVVVLFVLFSPLAAVIGLYLIRKFSHSKLLHWMGWIAITPTIITFVCLAASIAYDMRPVPTYDPQNYQHLVGQHLKEAKSELDTKFAVSSSGRSGGITNHYMSFRGMVIRANSDGIIIDVKKKRQH